MCWDVGQQCKIWEEHEINNTFWASAQILFAATHKPEEVMLPDLWLLICTYMVGSYPEDRPYKTYMMAESI